MSLDKYFKITAILVFLSVVFTTTNCTYKNAQEVFPIDTVGCKTTNISFQNDIVPILVANCYSCHSIKNSLLGSGFVLEGYSNDTMYVNNSNPNANIYNNVSDPNVNDFYHMPKGLPSISACEIIKIKAWIDEGYKNN